MQVEGAGDGNQGLGVLAQRSDDVAGQLEEEAYFEVVEVACVGVGGDVGGEGGGEGGGLGGGVLAVGPRLWEIQSGMTNLRSSDTVGR